jgi:hypothetical protein
MAKEKIRVWIKYKIQLIKLNKKYLDSIEIENESLNGATES